MPEYTLLQATTTVDNNRAYCLLLIKSSTGKIEQVYVPVDHDHPKLFAKAVTRAFKKHVPKAKRLFYSCVLFKKPVVSIATLAKTTNSHLGTGHGYHPVIKATVRDTLMTEAIHNPDTLDEVDPADFFATYKRSIGLEEGPRDEAIMLHFDEGNKAALKIIGGIVTTAVGAIIKLMTDEDN